MRFLKQLKIINIVIFIIMFMSACDGGSSDSPGSDGDREGNGNSQTDPSALSPPGAQRDWLTFEHLFDPIYPHLSPIHNDYFMPVGESQEALHAFSGTIQVDSRRLTGNFTEFYIAEDESFKNFPLVDLSFVSDGDSLIPLNRDRQVVLGDNSFWGIILDPGKVWSEEADQGWSRAIFLLHLFQHDEIKVTMALRRFYIMITK